MTDDEHVITPAIGGALGPSQAANETVGRLTSAERSAVGAPSITQLVQDLCAFALQLGEFQTSIETTMKKVGEAAEQMSGSADKILSVVEGMEKQGDAIQGVTKYNAAILTDLRGDWVKVGVLLTSMDGFLGTLVPLMKAIAERLEDRE